MWNYEVRGHKDSWGCWLATYENACILGLLSGIVFQFNLMMIPKWNCILVGTLKNYYAVEYFLIYSINISSIYSFGIVWPYPLITIYMCFLSIKVANPLFVANIVTNFLFAFLFSMFNIPFSKSFSKLRWENGKIGKEIYSLMKMFFILWTLSLYIFLSKHVFGEVLSVNFIKCLYSFFALMQFMVLLQC